MTWLWWIVGILGIFGIFIFTLLFFSNLHVHINYFHDGDNDELKIKTILWKVFRYTYTIPVISVDKETPTIVMQEEEDSSAGHEETNEKMSIHDFVYDMRQFNEFLTHVLGFHTILRHFLATVSINQFSWKSVVGTSDAALTGSIGGVLWGIKGNVVGLIGNYFKVRSLPELAIQPVFNQAISRTELKCMLSFRIGNAILGTIKVYRHWRNGRPFKLKKGSEQRRDMNV
ncbi:DUF2953 domain-containing protein [Alteribacter aurantiacus]|uniref:DUF2953 domain-containing protein n=1 Tax=Alteribacter aurantiacus TaxID=254410 RepID=UPI0003FAE2D0|nr:DUF2953 domain-containing protein [Alteribacter aurantiacus]